MEALLSHPCFLFQVPNQPQGRFLEPDNRDWRGRSAQIPASGEERSWENIRENRDFGSRQQDGNQFSRQDQLSSQFTRSQISSDQMVIKVGGLWIRELLFKKLFDLSARYINICNCLVTELLSVDQLNLRNFNDHLDFVINLSSPIFGENVEIACQLLKKFSDLSRWFFFSYVLFVSFILFFYMFSFLNCSFYLYFSLFSDEADKLCLYLFIFCNSSSQHLCSLNREDQLLLSWRLRCLGQLEGEISLRKNVFLRLWRGI